MSYQQLTKESRIKIEVYLSEGYTVTAIAQKMAIHRSTIYRELKRCPLGHYHAEK